MEKKNYIELSNIEVKFIYGLFFCYSMFIKLIVLRISI